MCSIMFVLFSVLSHRVGTLRKSIIQPAHLDIILLNPLK